MRLKIRVPATTANLGPGYDILGMAINLYNEFEISFNEDLSDDNLEIIYLDHVKQSSSVDVETVLPTSKENLFYKAYEKFFIERNLNPPKIHMRAVIGVPVSRGLGSSSTAILAGFIAAREILRIKFNDKLSMTQFFNEAVLLEGHPDNIAPALYGGLRLSVPSGEITKVVELPFNAPLRIGGVIPKYALKTSEARAVLETTFSKEIIAFQAARTSLLTHLLAKSEWKQSDYDLLPIAIEDRIHQDARSKLVVGMKETFKYWKQLDCLAAFLSGAGPTLLGFWPRDSDLEKYKLSKALTDLQIESLEVLPEIDRKGFSIEPL